MFRAGLLGGLMLLLLVPEFLPAGRTYKNEKCAYLGKAYSDGRGNNRTKGRGGKELRIPLGKIKRYYEANSEDRAALEKKRETGRDTYLKITRLSGKVRVVVIYARYLRGSWKKIYKGGPIGVKKKHITFGLAKFEPYWRSKKMTHLILMVNGEDDRYMPVKGKVKAELCSCDPSKKKKKQKVSTKYIQGFYGKYGRGWDPNSTSGGGNCNDGKSGRINWSDDWKSHVARGLYLGKSRIYFKDHFTIIAVEWEWVGRVSSNRHTIVWYNKSGEIELIWKRGCG